MRPGSLPVTGAFRSRVALVSTWFTLFDPQMPPDLPHRLRAHVRRSVEILSGFAEVVETPLIEDEDGARAVRDRLDRERPDAVVFAPAMAAPPSFAATGSTRRTRTLASIREPMAVVCSVAHGWVTSTGIASSAGAFHTTTGDVDPTIVGVARACREAGVSRTSYYRWTARASRYGLGVLMPKDRRPPVMPTHIPAHEEEEVILAEAVARPTLGPAGSSSTWPSGGSTGRPTGVQKVPRRHRLGTRRLRVAALAALTAADTGLVAPRALEPYGFCLWAARAGDPVGLDAFHVGKLEWIGPVWQLTAVDTATRWAFCRLVVGHVSSAVPGAFVNELAKETWRAGFMLTGVLPPGVPPPPVRSPGGPGGRPARLPGPLQATATQPRRLHAGADPRGEAGGALVRVSRVRHLSPQPVARTP